MEAPFLHFFFFLVVVFLPVREEGLLSPSPFPPFCSLPTTMACLGRSNGRVWPRFSHPSFQHMKKAIYPKSPNCFFSPSPFPIFLFLSLSLSSPHFPVKILMLILIFLSLSVCVLGQIWRSGLRRLTNNVKINNVCPKTNLEKQ